MRRTRRPCTLLIGEGAFVHSASFIEELHRRFELRFVPCAPAGFTRGKVLLRELALLVKLLFSPQVYRPENLVVSGSGPVAGLAVSRVLGAFGRELDVFVYNFYLHQLGQNALVRRILAFLLTERVVIAAQSQVDADYFRSLSASVRLALVPYGQGPVANVTEDDVRLGEYVFAGGYTNRDYDRLLRCAQKLSTLPFVIACSSYNKLTESIPANVDVQRDLDPALFHKLLAGARLVVVPLADDVGSAGQMVTLAAMNFGKAIVVADSPVVAQYVDERVSGLVYERTSDTSLCTTIATVIADDRRLLELGSAARALYSERFTLSAYHQGLLDALDREFTGGTDLGLVDIPNGSTSKR